MKRLLPPARERALDELYPAGGSPAVQALFPDWAQTAIQTAADRRGIKRNPGWRSERRKKAVNGARQPGRPSLAHQGARTATATKQNPFDRPDPEVQERACLNCGKNFESQWKGNRLCKACKGRSAPGFAGVGAP